MANNTELNELRSSEGELIASHAEREIETSEAQPARPVTAPVYPEGIRLICIILSLILSVFLVALDRTIIATAIPRIVSISIIPTPRTKNPE